MWFEKYKYLWLELTLRSSLSPTRQVGVKAMDRNRVRGYQNQNWVKTSIPTTPSMFMWPVRDCSEIVMLRPPETEKKGCPVTRSIILSISLNSMSWFCGKYSRKIKMSKKIFHVKSKYFLKLMHMLHCGFSIVCWAPILVVIISERRKKKQDHLCNGRLTLSSS